MILNRVFLNETSCRKVFCLSCTSTVFLIPTFPCLYVPLSLFVSLTFCFYFVSTLSFSLTLPLSSTLKFSLFDFFSSRHLDLRSFMLICLIKGSLTFICRDFFVVKRDNFNHSPQDRSICLS